MRLRDSLLLLASFAACDLAKADTIHFTATVTQQYGLSAVPVGSVYTGFVHYDGSVNPNFTGVPPTVTSYGFNYPSAPASVDDLKWVYVQRNAIGQPLFAELAYIDFSAPAASFDIIANQFTILTPVTETANSFGYVVYESGTVSYTYTTDPVLPSPSASPVPEPASLALVGSGALAALNWKRRTTL